LSSLKQSRHSQNLMALFPAHQSTSLAAVLFILALFAITHPQIASSIEFFTPETAAKKLEEITAKCDEKFRAIPDQSVIYRLRPAEKTRFSEKQKSDPTMFHESQRATIEAWEKVVVECHEKRIRVAQGTSEEESMTSFLKSLLVAKLSIAGGLVRGDYAYGDFANLLSKELERLSVRGDSAIKRWEFKDSANKEQFQRNRKQWSAPDSLRADSEYYK
jgi:hypothetical protein